MKKFALTLFVCIAFSFLTKAQEGPKIIKSEPQLSDIYNVLDAINIKIFRFDLSEFLNDTYTVTLYVNEYENGKQIKQVGSSNLGMNIESLNNVPEDMREAFRKLKQVAEGKQEWDNIKEMSLYISKVNDSTTTFTVNIPDVMRLNQRVKLHPVGEPKRFLYNARPFKYQAADKNDSISIPLIMYGSYWLDTKNNVIRQCGESEIDPEMKAEILTHIPHYFVVGLQLQKAKKDR